MFIFIDDSGSGAVDPFLSDLWGAYGLSKLVGSYAGSAIRVRRSSDNTEQDIGFSGSSLNTSALTSFAGAGNAFITKWYDQSGAANDLAQATSSKQPQIVDAGAYIGEALWDGTDDAMVSPNGTTANFATVFVGGRARTMSGASIASFYDRAGTAMANGIYNSGSNDGWVGAGVLGSATNEFDDAFTADDACYCSKFDRTQGSVSAAIRRYVNGTEHTSTGVSGTLPGSVSAGAWYFGSNSSGTTFVRIACKTILIYEAAKSDADIASISALIRPTPPSDGLTSYTTGLWGVFSLRRQISSYSGSAIRVRRSSDNAEQDIGFSSGLLDTASLLSFCGAGDGFIAKWYDQNGSGRYFSHATTTKQPKLVSSGAMLRAVTFDGTDDTLVSSANNGAPSVFTLFVKGHNESFSTSAIFLETTNQPFSGANNGANLSCNTHLTALTTQSGGSGYVINDWTSLNLVGQVVAARLDRSQSTADNECAVFSGGKQFTKTGGGTLSSTSGNFTAAAWNLGSRSGTSDFLNGAIESFAIYEASVSDANIERISRALG